MFAFLSHYVRWDTVALIASMGALTVFELIGVINGRYLTITDFLKGVLPIPVRIMVWAWLGWHFIVSDFFPGAK